METFVQQVLTILTTSPGNLTYHLVLTFSIAGALQAAFNYWRGSGLPQGRRMVIGLGLLLLLRVALFLISGLAWQINPNLPPALLPVLDRTATALGLVLIVWLWVFPAPVRLADGAAVLFCLPVLTLALFSVVWSSNQTGAGSFNGSPLDRYWEAVALFLILIGCLLLLVRRPDGWGLGLSMLGLVLLGHLVHWFIPLQGSDYPGAVRLAQMAAFPLLLMLPQRFWVHHPVGAPAAALSASSPPAAGSGLTVTGADPALVLSFFDLLLDPGASANDLVLAQAVAYAMQAELCLLVSPPDTNEEINIRCGYDLVNKRPLPGQTIDGKRISRLASALCQGRSLRLSADSAAHELPGLSQALQLPRPGSVLSAAVASNGTELLLGLILLRPSARRDWTSADEAHLLVIAQALAQFSSRSQQQDNLASQLAKARQNLKEQQAQIEQADQQEKNMAVQIAGYQEQGNRGQVQAESLAALIAAQEISQENLARLQAENARLVQAVSSAKSQAVAAEAGRVALVAEIAAGPIIAPAEVQELEGEMRLALEEVARLRALLAAGAQVKSVEPVRPAAAPPPPASADPAPAGISNEQQEVIASMTQDLRQPMSSIVGYTDLLLSESVGILGALQRKFLERIRVSAERIGALIEDLVRITSLDSGKPVLAWGSVDLNTVIDEAIAFTAGQLREKNIALRVDLPEGLPQIYADHDALQQVLINLLKNAGAATPTEGKISLRGRVELGDDQLDYVFLQVTDQGGGIPSSDIPRVFTRLYRADNPLIQGVGDTGVGLSIVRTLVEAHDGRVWVDTEIGKGSTFSILLPVSATSNRNGGHAGQVG